MIRYFSFMAPYDWWLRRRQLRFAQDLVLLQLVREHQPQLVTGLPLSAGGARRDQVPFTPLVRFRQFKGHIRDELQN